MVYVFDYCSDRGYLVRVPEVMAKGIVWILRNRRSLDYSETLYET